jgi:hypothetical protein
LQGIDPFDVEKADKIEEYNCNEAAYGCANDAIRFGQKIVEEDGGHYKKHIGQQIYHPMF